MNKGRFELKGYTLHGIGLDDVCLNKGSLQEKGLSGLAITDINTIEGWCSAPVFSDESFRFIYGVDVRLQKKTYSLDDEEEYEEDDTNYAANVTLLIKNEIGKKNLFDILFEASTRARHLSAYPVIEIDILKRHREELPSPVYPL